MTEIFHIFKVRVEKAHELDNGIGVALALFLVFEGQQVFDHFLDMPTILTHHQMVSRGIIFHILYTWQSDIILNKSTGKSLDDKLLATGRAGGPRVRGGPTSGRAQWIEKEKPPGRPFTG